MKIHRVVSEIWPWEFSLLHLKREVFLRIPEYAGVAWSSACGALATKARKSMVVETSFAGAPVYASAPISAYDGTVYTRVDVTWSRDCTLI